MDPAPSTTIAATVPHIPPEIRANIACYCSVQTLVRLCSVDRLWAAEAEPFLYRGVQLRFSDDNNAALLSCIDFLSRAPRKLSRIRTVLLELARGSHPPPADVLRRRISRLLLGLAALDDLRIRGQDVGFQRTILDAVAQEGVPFRLRTLYVFNNPIDGPDLSAVLITHARTLRIVGMHLFSDFEQRLRHVATDLRIHTVVFNPDLVLFTYLRTPSLFAVSVDAPTPAHIADVERSLADDPSLRIAGAFVNMLQIDCNDEPRDELVRSYVTHFPRVVKLSAIIPRGELDVDALAVAVSPFPRLGNLQISRLGQDGPDPDKPWRVRLALADHMTSHGCTMLRQIKFTDWTTARRDVRLDDTPVGPWYDAGKPAYPLKKNISLYE